MSATHSWTGHRSGTTVECVNCKMKRVNPFTSANRSQDPLYMTGKKTVSKEPPCVVKENP